MAIKIKIKSITKCSNNVCPNKIQNNNDDVVFNMYKIGFAMCQLQHYHQNCSNPHCLPGFTSTKPINIQTNVYKTNNAYILVHMRASIAMKLKTEPHNIRLSPRLTQLLNTRNYGYEKKFKIKNLLYFFQIL